MTAKLVFDSKLLVLAAVILAAIFFVEPRFAGTVIALAIATLVLAPLPGGTRAVVFAVMIGLATGIASFNLFAPGVFQEHVTKEFGWSQSQYAFATVVGTIVTVASSLFIGKLFDRQGVRKWALISIVARACCRHLIHCLFAGDRPMVRQAAWPGIWRCARRDRHRRRGAVAAVAVSDQ
jgi:hypothetical protein